MTYSKDAVIAIYENKDAADSTNINNVDKSGAIAVWKSSDTDPKFNLWKIRGCLHNED